MTHRNRGLQADNFRGTAQHVLVTGRIRHDANMLTSFLCFCLLIYSFITHSSFILRNLENKQSLFNRKDLFNIKLVVKSTFFFLKIDFLHLHCIDWSWSSTGTEHCYTSVFLIVTLIIIIFVFTGAEIFVIFLMSFVWWE